MPIKLTYTEIAKLCKAGGMAPSGGNVQPWKVLAHSSSLTLSLHPKRTGGFLDIEHYASKFSLGSFIENVSLTSTELGLAHKIVIEDRDDSIATIQYLQRLDVLEKDPLYQQIPNRHTNRQLHHGDCFPDETVDELRTSIQKWPFARLTALSDKQQKKNTASILGKGDALRIKHDPMFFDMMSEIRWDQEEAIRSRDGVAISTLELPKQAILMLQLLHKYSWLRKFIPSPAFEKISTPSVMESSHMCVLSLRHELSTENLINAGRAVQRLWLKATEMGVSFQPMTALPFMLIRTLLFSGSGFNTAENDKLTMLGQQLTALYSLDKDEFPLFIFRIARPVAPASDIALRLPPNSIYSTVLEEEEYPAVLNHGI